jgi:cytochrome c
MFLALLFFMVVVGLLPAGYSAAQEETPGPTVTPTPDRLAAPPTVENPNQADEGAQLYWLHCQPCHGDRGQGLTDEWRAQYPPDDRNCWESGCHGNRPYEEGFVLPTAVPPLVGEDSLQRFERWGEVYDFMRAAMPYQAAGSLAEEEYLAIVAFLARARERWDGTIFDAENIAGHTIRPAATATATSPLAESAPAMWPAVILLVVVLAAVGVVLWWRRR